MNYSFISKAVFCTLLIFSLFAVQSTIKAQDISGDDYDKEGLKVGVVKNSSLVKIEVKGKAEVLNLKELYSLLGINKLDRTYRSIASLEQMKVKGNNAEIDGEALLAVISGKDGIILLIVDANNPKNFTYTALKQRIVRKGDRKDRYHSQDEGIQRPDLVTISSNGVAWVSYDQSGFYNLNYVPLVIPKHISTTFEGSNSTEEWDIKVKQGNITVTDGKKVLLNASVFNGFGETADNIKSIVNWGGKPREVNDLTFNIVEDTRSMAGNDVLIEFTEDELSKLCNYPKSSASWESIEIVKPMNNVVRDGKTYIPYAVIARNGIGIVEIPTEGDDIRIYNLGNKPYDPNEKDNPRNFRPAYSINGIGTMFGYIEIPSKDSKTQYLALFSPEFRFGIKVELDFSVKREFSVISTSNYLNLREGDGNIRATLGINNLQMM